MIAKKRSRFADTAKQSIKMKQKFELADLVYSIYGEFSSASISNYDSDRNMGLVVDIIEPVIADLGEDKPPLECVYCIEWLTGVYCGNIEKFSGKSLMKV